MILKSCSARLPFVLVTIGTLVLGLLETTNGNATSLDAFEVEFDEPVALRIQATSHYVLETEDGDEEWSRVLPPGPAGHLVYIRDAEVDDDSSIRPYTVTLFHQLKCLDIIRRQYVLLLRRQSEPRAGDSTIAITPLAKHCIEYVRQALQCRPNLWMESTKDAGRGAVLGYDAVCVDWTRVYDEAIAKRETYADHFRSEAH